MASPWSLESPVGSTCLLFTMTLHIPEKTGHKHVPFTTNPLSASFAPYNLKHLFFAGIWSWICHGECETLQGQ